MAIRPPINFKKWIDDHCDKLKPPVGNQVVYKDTEQIIMVVGGPNIRKDYHYNEGEEFFYQLEGDMVLRLMEDGKPMDVPIKEGDIYLLPPRVLHSPQRYSNTIGLVVERRRNTGELDGFKWFCDECHTLLHEEFVQLKDIVKQLPPIFQAFWADTEKRTCKKCSAILQKP
jgi:3-hydroxyanthranilate 3,4-dioxygenase